MTNRIDRLEALMETILLAIQAQQATQNADRQEYRESIQDIVQIIATDSERQWSAISEIQLGIREMQSEIREMQSEVRGLQTENRRILDTLLNRDDADSQ